jgi:diguanylate cyclase (GGDEF)-like protein/PAS domain S-box-containing protein
MKSILTNSKHKDPQSRIKIRAIAASLFSLSLVAIFFTIMIIQIQSGVAAYLSGLSLWSRGQLETVRQSELYSRTGDPSILLQAREWYQIPLGDLLARQLMEKDKFDYELARQGLLQGGNHFDDAERMIWLFSAFQHAPYISDAIAAWQETDIWLLKLGQVIDHLEFAWQQNGDNSLALSKLQEELDLINHELADKAGNFRNAMNSASRALVFILKIASIILFVLLSGIAALLILKLTSAIRNSEIKFRKTFEQAAIGIAQVDDKGNIIEANDALCDTLKYSREELLSLKYNELIFPEDRYIGVAERIALEKGEKDNLCLKQRLRCGDSSVVWTKITMSSYEVGASSTNFIGIIEDVSEQHRLSEELNYQARHDDLTGLINRRAFEGYLSEALLRARSENFVHGLCFIDLDQFKIVNDTSGHLVGDQLLQQVSHLLSGHLRKGDLLARLGGDEFGLILDCCEPDEAIKLAEALRETLISTPFIWEGKSFSVGCSVGIVPITASSGDISDLLQAADSACQLAKEQGRNRVLLAYEDDKELTARRTQMEWLERIRHAINNDLFFLDAQKIVSINQDSDYRIEVLVRMKGEQGEVIPPGAFLPSAERFGLAHLLDRWVIARVCKYFKDYPEEISSLDACHINISGRSFDHDDFTDFTLGLLSTYQVPAHKICFEITETAAISNLMEVSKFMRRMRQAGCTFALDDFGSGLSSFAYLKQLEVEYLKIDGSFVQHIASDETDRAMVRAITDIGQTLGKIIVAEFVEDQQSLEYLQQMGVEYAQGFYLHRPESFELFLKNLKS